MEPAKGTKPRESEREEEQEQEQEHMKGHRDPLCLKVGEWKFKRKDKQGQEGLSSDWERRLNYPPLKEAVPGGEGLIPPAFISLQHYQKRSRSPNRLQDGFLHFVGKGTHPTAGGSPHV